jgi:hypothetical protein
MQMVVESAVGSLFKCVIAHRKATQEAIALRCCEAQIALREEQGRSQVVNFTSWATLQNVIV